MDEVEIFEQIIDKKSNCKLAILRGGLNKENPFQFMNEVVVNYIGDQKCCLFIDIRMNDPWTRVIINENIKTK